MGQTQPSFGTLFRTWREQRRVSQLALACDAAVSQKHLSYIESGRAIPSRDMVLLLAEHLDIPFRERNALLLAAGHAPFFQARPIDDPALTPVLAAIDRLLEAIEPNPALAIDRHWTMLASNAAVGWLIGDVDPKLLRPPVNVLRLSLHPSGLAPRILNLDDWRDHLLDRLRRQYRVTLDPVIDALLKELSGLPTPAKRKPRRLPAGPQEDIVVPLRLRTPHGDLSLLSTTTVFGTPIEITLSELSIETFYPADDQTAKVLGTRDT